MQKDKRKGLRAAVAALVMALIVLPVAIAGAQGHTSSGQEKGGSAKQLTRVKRQLKALTARVAAVEGKAGPSTLPPSGPAGGDLSGAFPNPELGLNVVGSPEIADNAVGSPEIAADAVGSSEIATAAVGATELARNSVNGVALQASSVGKDQLADGAVTPRALEIKSVGPEALQTGAVGARALGDAVFVEGNGVDVSSGSSREAKVICPANHPRLLSGGPEWLRDDNGTSIIYSSPSSVNGAANSIWVVRGRVNTGGPANTIFADALCI